MSKKIITIDSILRGISISDYQTRRGEFLSSIGIDPDMPSDDNGNKPSCLIRPTSLAKFSGTEITGVPLWFIKNPKTSNIYLYANDGKVHTITSSLVMGTALNSGNALSASSGNGGEYYDNYAYFAKNTDIARYGALNGTPSLTQDFWTSTLSLTALNDITYPSINGIEIPNHQMHRHTDDKLYFCDVLSNNKGCLHYIKTKKTTVEGDTDDGSKFNALDFDYGEYPVCIETYQGDLVVGLIEGVNTTVKQKPAKISFWDTTSDSFSSITSVELSDPLITAIRNVNGTLYIFSGFATGGCRVSKLVSGYRLEEIVWLPEVYPPISKGAVDHILNRIIFGSNTVESEVSGSVFALGAKEANLPMGLHNIARASASGTNPMATAVCYPTQTSGAIVPIIVGWKDDTPAYGIDKYSTTYGDVNVFRSNVFTVGGKFQIKEIQIPLAQAIAVNMTFTVKVYGDNGTTTPSATNKTLITVNNTNYPNSEKVIKIYPQEEFTNDFFLQIEWQGSVLAVISLPLIITLDIYED